MDTWYTYSPVVGNDTLSLDDWCFTPSTETLRVDEPGKLTFTAARGDVQVELTYGFRPDDYRVHVSGHVSGIGPDGATLVVGLGNGLGQTEADSAANQYDFGVVTKTDESKLKRFASLSPGETTVLSGPFEWVAVKSKYFVTALLAIDLASSAISGVTAVPLPGPPSIRASVRLGTAGGAAGMFAFSALRRPHGVPSAPRDRPRLLRHQPVRLAGLPHHHPPDRGRSPLAPGLDARSICSLAYGLVLVLFGIMIRLRAVAAQPEGHACQHQDAGDPAGDEGVAGSPQGQSAGAAGQRSSSCTRSTT